MTLIETSAPTQAAPASGTVSRGRVVMLVDNGVVGDSRVQKQAMSAAAAGWTVTLLGIRTSHSTDTAWSIGDAQVRLVRIQAAMRVPLCGFRRSMRRPFAYPPGRLGAHRAQEVRAREADLRVRFGRLALARRAGAPRWRAAVGRAGLLPARLALKVKRHWVRFRRAELDRLEAARQNPDAPLTRLGIRFWQLLLGPRSWRRLDPALWDWEMSLGPVVDRLKPDIIHANDFRMIGIGARAKLRAASRGRTVKLVWDAHELVSGMTDRPGSPRWLPGQVAHEREYTRDADAVVTVSPMLADLLRARHRLSDPPVVVLNAPEVSATGEAVPDLRALCGIAAATPLLVYLGGINEVRGVDLIVSAMDRLPGVHLALISLHPNGNREPAKPIEELAQELGVADRVHLLPYLPYTQVVPAVAAADAAVSPLRHLPNHEIALSNKFFEYSQARLPLVVSDVRAMADMVRTTGQGEVYRADDVEDYVRAVQQVLADPTKYRAAYDQPGLLEEWTWKRQAARLDDVYAKLVS
ncbi:glycosyltransferase family 4 protein [Krasilnikovia sp. M28-CT-15]|uniref:glycosyltransferase family 4 protein n=1 Tax=Krasilnikovia sp. M28-CT-15 TaxID=3373540 RepID=UPI00387769CB